MDYGLALAALLVLVLLQQYLAIRAGGAKGADGLAPGATPDQSLDNATYRLHRTHINGVENLASIAIVVIAGMMLAGSGLILAIGAWIYVIGRLVYIYMYLNNIRAQSGGPRSMIFASGWGMIVLLALYDFYLAIF